MATLAFAHGCKVLLLPNDRNGLCLGFLTPTPAGASLLKLTPEMATSVHPLVRGTEAAQRTWGCTVTTERAQLSSDGQSKKWLNLEHPFLLLYNTDHLIDDESALDFLLGLQRLPTNIPRISVQNKVYICPVYTLWSILWALGVKTEVTHALTHAHIHNAI